MPYSVGTAAAVYPGDVATLASAETVASGWFSQAMARTAITGAGTKNITFSYNFAAAPTATVIIQAAMSDTTAGWAAANTVYSGSNLQNDTYTDAGSSLFYRFGVPSYSAGGAFTGGVGG